VKTMKLIGLAALALMAFGGAGSASASPTTLCKTATDSPNCATNDQYSANTSLTASGEFGVEFPGMPWSLKCTQSTLNAETTGQTGEPLPVKLSQWTFSGCTTPNGKACTGATTNLPYAGGSLAWTTGSNGTLKFGSGGTGEPRWTFECPSVGLKCSFAIPGITFNGGSPGQLSLPNVTLDHKGQLECFGLYEAKLIANSFTISSPSSAYVAKPETAKPGTGLCKANESPCAAANLYRAGTVITAEATNFKITGAGAEYTCGKATLVTETTARSDNPLPLTVTGSVLSSCKYGAGSCNTYTEELSSGSIAFAFLNEGSWKSGVTWKFECAGGTFTCAYMLTPETGGAILEGTENRGPYPARVIYNEVALSNSPKTKCGFTTRLTATFNVSSPKPIYVVKVA